MGKKEKKAERRAGAGDVRGAAHYGGIRDFLNVLRNMQQSGGTMPPEAFAEAWMPNRRRLRHLPQIKAKHLENQDDGVCAETRRDTAPGW